MTAGSMSRVERPSDLALRVLDVILLAVIASYLGLLTYELIAAWLAPRCQWASDLDGWWCLPIGFEGPFGDFWANHSFSNARLNAAINMILLSTSIAFASYFVVKRHGRARAIAYGAGATLLLVMLIKSYFLNDWS